MNCDKHLQVIARPMHWHMAWWYVVWWDVLFCSWIGQVCVTICCDGITQNCPSTPCHALKSKFYTSSSGLWFATSLKRILYLPKVITNTLLIKYKSNYRIVAFTNISRLTKTTFTYISLSLTPGLHLSTPVLHPLVPIITFLLLFCLASHYFLAKLQVIFHLLL